MWTLRKFEIADSTMDLARQIAEGQLLPTHQQSKIPLPDFPATRSAEIIVARQQRAGRGREGRSWVSADDSGIYLTYLLFPEVSVEKLAGFTLVAGLAIARLAKRYDIPLLLKWPNDVLAKHQRKYCKCAGILTE